MPDKRLIDANALVDKISLDWGLTHQNQLISATTKLATADAMCKLIGEVAKCQTIDAVEVVHAMWIREPRGVVRCSYCDKGYRLTNGGANVLKFFYCPNCGAKMDENKKED